MLSDYYFLFMAGFMWQYTLYLWSIKETELSAEKIVIDIVMIGCGIIACVLSAIVVNIFSRNFEERNYVYIE